MKSPNALSSVWITLLLLLAAFQSYSQTTERHLTRIHLNQKGDFSLLKDLELDLATHRIGSYAEVVATDDEIRQIHERGFRTEILPVDPPGTHVGQYRTYENVVAYCQYLAAEYPDIVMLDTLGLGQVWGLWIPVLKVSDNPTAEEDEPAILFDGLHHAREPVSTESVLNILQHLLRNYGSDPQVTRWINEFEIWFIPMLNPEGYKYLIDNALSSPWWRKNLSDNDNDGLFNPAFDGVDLNRNYDYNWSSGGSAEINSWTYKGSAPFSESETAAKRKLALEQKFLLSNTYHSYGEVVLYPWSELADPPDKSLIVEIAGEVASRIQNTTGTGTYDFEPSSGYIGYSKNWMYAVAGTIEFTVETATRFIPPSSEGIRVAENNLQGGLYLLERAEGPGITGHVLDETNGQPVVAGVKLLGIDTDLITLRTTDTLYGRFWRLLQAGLYSIRVTADGYIAQNVNNIRVNDSTWTEIEVFLKPVGTGIDADLTRTASEKPMVRVFPNPSSEAVKMAFELNRPMQISIGVTDLQGRNIRTLADRMHQPGSHLITWDARDERGIRVAPGIYMINIKNDGDSQHVRVVILDP